MKMVYPMRMSVCFKRKTVRTQRESKWNTEDYVVSIIIITKTCLCNILQFCMAVKNDNFLLIFIPPTLKKWGAYWFRLVRASARVCVRSCVRPSVQKKFKLGF